MVWVICFDFGFQARILLESGYGAAGENPQTYEENPVNEADAIRLSDINPNTDNLSQEGCRSQEPVTMSKEEYFEVLDELKFKNLDKDTNIQDGNTSCLATCTTSDIEDDPFKSSYLFEAEEAGGDRHGSLTSCVGTRWFRAPELLYGSTNYSFEIDLWSLGCILAELFTLQPLFPGTSDIDQLSRIMSVLGNLNEESWSGCVKLPDYKTISFNKVENPIGLEACLPNRTTEEISLVKKLVCYDPARRATAMELFQEKYFNEEPLPVPLSQLHVPSTKNEHDEDFPGGWYDYNEMDSDSDFEDFGPVNVTTTSTGFSVQFPWAQKGI